MRAGMREREKFSEALPYRARVAHLEKASEKEAKATKTNKKRGWSQDCDNKTNLFFKFFAFYFFIFCVKVTKKNKLNFPYQKINVLKQNPYWNKTNFNDVTEK